MEVRYDKWQGSRFRHGTGLIRFRPDKDAEDCTLDQVVVRPRKSDPTVDGLLSGSS